MQNKEELWLRKRLGLITASELNEICSASGKIIDTNRSYIRKKRFERTHGFTHGVVSRAMEIGKEQEPMAVAWLRSHFADKKIVYSQELDEIPFWSVDWARFGASPDCFSEDEKCVYEIKTLVSGERIEFFADERTTFLEKLAAVWKEHGAQVLGQMLSNPKVEHVILLKFIPQDDNIIEDCDSPLADWRGNLFVFSRAGLQAELDEMRERIIMFDRLIDSPLSPSAMGKEK